MGHEIPRCLLVLLLVLHCDAFTEIFPPSKKKGRKKKEQEKENFSFKSENHKLDWQLLLESYL